jgi:hypothetical protein
MTRLVARSFRVALVAIAPLVTIGLSTAACHRDETSRSPSSVPDASAPTASLDTVRPPATALPTPPPPSRERCGSSPSDWCASPPGDPCGVHKDTAACKADPKCKGMPYTGESFVACKPDGKGFWTNCPSVGCISR